MGQWFQRLRINAKYGVVNDATIQGYLRAASQLENVWQQIDEKVDALLLEGLPPWEAYAHMGEALAFVRACRLNVVFVQELLKAEGTTGNANAGYLPRITYEQALALCEHIEPMIEEALKAADSTRATQPSTALPLRLGPHVGGGYQSFPLSHLQGFIGAVQEMRDWTAGLLAKYELALQTAREPVPAVVATHLERMKSQLDLGDFHMRAGVDMVGQISQGQATEELQRKAEELLWEAMEGYYSISQLIAMPGAHFRPAPPPQRTARPGQVPLSPAQTFRQSEMPAPQPGAQATEQGESDTLSMLNQVTAEPGPARNSSAQPDSETIDLLNQVGASSTAQSKAPEQVSLDAAGLLDQNTATPGKAQPAPDAASSFERETGAQRTSGSVPDVAALFGQNTPAPRASQPTSIQAPPDMAGLLDQHPAQAASDEQGTKSVKDHDHKMHVNPAQSAAPEDATLDLLSEICRDEEKAGE